jgi:hypothetical protein
MAKRTLTAKNARSRSVRFGDQRQSKVERSDIAMSMPFEESELASEMPGMIGREKERKRKGREERW